MHMAGYTADPSLERLRFSLAFAAASFSRCASSEAASASSFSATASPFLSSASRRFCCAARSVRSRLAAASRRAVVLRLRVTSAAPSFVRFACPRAFRARRGAGSMTLAVVPCLGLDFPFYERPGRLSVATRSYVVANRGGPPPDRLPPRADSMAEAGQAACNNQVR
jgi:hypothetical protein